MEDHQSHRKSLGFCHLIVATNHKKIRRQTNKFTTTRHNVSFAHQSSGEHPSSSVYPPLAKYQNLPFCLASNYGTQFCFSPREMDAQFYPQAQGLQHLSRADRSTQRPYLITF
ncbi:hypothetical protein MGG_16634 [Pyricularia oryzae 70-15]|uniref:Uncharacterized protein n=2 Tax=Pyricularia oryzae TaxID=318829 RepID=G4N0U3_PYRO7|nr:uncharacterized protein MGG_16634 [Pyricularia oryzae 70-15]EHA51526.1 hypothetical protein MGG_16634 [Pyricularia oryzae 70-15]KAI7919240.1 hypothetical protein M9X92_006461 [Pyricularia oryzae]KAI7923605.1 hypothetical protein M0657_005070 [Pyricularia oryzae]QBZ57991.1 hypothetical protein PoMZ_02929 [Pyricularia oryzae]